MLKFGGWYSDIDTIILKPLTDFDTKFGFEEDVLVSTDQFSSAFQGVVDPEGFQVLGESVANGFFRSRKSGEEFLRKTIRYFVYTFDNQGWSTGGSKPLTMALRDTCGLRVDKGYVTGTVLTLIPFFTFKSKQSAVVLFRRGLMKSGVPTIHLNRLGEN